jgi:hypothetical protein
MPRVILPRAGKPEIAACIRAMVMEADEQVDILIWLGVSRTTASQAILW